MTTTIISPATAAVLTAIRKAWADYEAPAKPGWALGQKLNLASFMGERMGSVLARLEAAERVIREVQHRHPVAGLRDDGCGLCQAMNEYDRLTGGPL